MLLYYRAADFSRLREAKKYFPGLWEILFPACGLPSRADIKIQTKRTPRLPVRKTERFYAAARYTARIVFMRQGLGMLASQLRTLSRNDWSAPLL